MQITPANTSDIPDLCKLLNILFTQEADFQPDVKAQTRGLAGIIDNSEIGLILIAREGAKALGMVNLLWTISTALGERVALLEDMVVAPEARSSGLGSQILQQAILQARAAGCKRITLLTDRTNTDAQRFYRKHGFDFSAMIPMRQAL